jgi:putative endonuclease
MDNKKIGSLGEEIACDYLISQGYEILDRNRIFYERGRKAAELDILASKGKYTYLIEVKHRRSTKYGRAIEAINTKKIDSLMVMYNTYLLKYPYLKIVILTIDRGAGGDEIELVDCF